MYLVPDFQYSTLSNTGALHLVQLTRYSNTRDHDILLLSASCTWHSYDMESVSCFGETVLDVDGGTRSLAGTSSASPSYYPVIFAALSVH